MEFTQYLLPDGRKRQITIDLDEGTEAKGRALVEAGARFEAEILMTGLVSLTCEIDDCEGEVNVLAHEIIPNGPGVKEAVVRLIEDATEGAGVA